MFLPSSVISRFSDQIAALDSANCVVYPLSHKFTLNEKFKKAQAALEHYKNLVTNTQLIADGIRRHSGFEQHAFSYQRFIAIQESLHFVKARFYSAVEFIHALYGAKETQCTLMHMMSVSDGDLVCYLPYSYYAMQNKPIYQSEKDKSIYIRNNASDPFRGDPPPLHEIMQRSIWDIPSSLKVTKGVINTITGLYAFLYERDKPRKDNVAARYEENAAGSQKNYPDLIDIQVGYDEHLFSCTYSYPNRQAEEVVRVIADLLKETLLPKYFQRILWHMGSINYAVASVYTGNQQAINAAFANFSLFRANYADDVDEVPELDVAHSRRIWYALAVSGDIRWQKLLYEKGDRAAKLYLAYFVNPWTNYGLYWQYISHCREVNSLLTLIRRELINMRSIVVLYPKLLRQEAIVQALLRHDVASRNEMLNMILSSDHWQSPLPSISRENVIATIIPHVSNDVMRRFVGHESHDVRAEVAKYCDEDIALLMVSDVSEQVRFNLAARGYSSVSRLLMNDHSDSVRHNVVRYTDDLNILQHMVSDRSVFLVRHEVLRRLPLSMALDLFANDKSPIIRESYLKRLRNSYKVTPYGKKIRRIAGHYRRNELLCWSVNSSVVAGGIVFSDENSNEPIDMKDNSNDSK